MKKVIVFSNMYPSKAHPTFGIFVKNQVELLKKENIDVEVIAIDDPRTGKFRTIKKYITLFFRALIAMVKNRKNTSLTHAHYVFPTGFISYIGKKVFRLPYVVTAHGGDIDKMAKKNKVIRALTGRILREAEKVIVVGERLKEEVVGQFDVRKDDVSQLSMGVDRSVFKKRSADEVRSSLRLHKNETIYLFVGNMIREKGVYELLQAFYEVKKTNRHASLYLIGAQRDGQFIGELQSYIKTNAVEDVYFKQPLQQEQLARWMAAADVLVLPSYHEGFGLVALEALASGTPVVGTDVGGLSYLLKNKVGLLVPSKDVKALKKALIQALDPTSFDEEAIEAVVQEHATQAILEKLLAMYKQVSR